MEEINEVELRSICQAIHLRYGIDLENYEIKSLSRRIYKVIQKYDLESIHGLWIRLLREHGFIFQVIDDLTVGLTELFRNPKMWQFIRDVLLPEFASRPQIRVWHAACSTGEEVYSMRMVLRDVKLSAKTVSLATDINQSALEEARKGRFHHLSMPAYRRNFANYHAGGMALDELLMDREGDHLPLSRSVTRHTQFEVQNLVNSPYPKDQDIVFCRNVLIYFDKALQGRVFAKLVDSLRPGGVLILGFYDSRPDLASLPLEQINPGFKMYRRLAKVDHKI